MDSGDGFFWVGNHVALDFVNTLAAGPEGALELLRSDSDLWRWASATPLADCLRPGRPGARLDPEVRRLRATLHALFTARIEATAPPRAALGHLNAALAWRVLAPRLTYAGGRFQLRREPLSTNRDLLRALARAGAELLEQAPPGRLRHCAGQGCVLLFLDVSKTGRRRWCSMAGCGNRAKAQTHYRRQREGT